MLPHVEEERNVVRSYGGLPREESSEKCGGGWHLGVSHPKRDQEEKSVNKELGCLFMKHFPARSLQ